MAKSMNDRMLDAHQAIMKDLELGYDLPLKNYEQDFNLPEGTLGEGKASEHYQAMPKRRRLHW